jgi:(p)ppGpp synthase/HD superfamily hydrolase
MADLERALQIAVQAHAGQKDKNGAAYIFHPIRVMTRCTTPNAKIVALLHDVVEDTATTFEQLQDEGFSPEVLAALRLLTHAPEVPYEEYIDSIMTDRTAMEVKMADLEDNADIRRLRQVDDRSVERLRKYLAAYRRLTAKRDEQGT